MTTNKEKLKEKIKNEEDFIYCPRLGNSLNKFKEKNPDGVDDDKIAKVLLLNTEEVESIFQSAINKIRKGLKLK